MSSPVRLSKSEKYNSLNPGGASTYLTTVKIYIYSYATAVLWCECSGGWDALWLNFINITQIWGKLVWVCWVENLKKTILKTKAERPLLPSTQTSLQVQPIREHPAAHKLHVQMISVQCSHSVSSGLTAPLARGWEGSDNVLARRLVKSLWWINDEVVCVKLRGDCDLPHILTFTHEMNLNVSSPSSEVRLRLF